ncbi:MAG: fluoride efflux transporter CrcB [Nitrospirae bacterium]|nr:fluoride efflux transporter CrcB [Nitrospirota bacterium]
MLKVLIVGAGGFIGSACRYMLSGWVHKILDSASFPYGTLAVNIGGCFFIGFLGGLSDTRQVFAPETRLFLFIGVLGGFTTFSSFGYETFALARDGEIFAALSNIFLQMVLCLSAVYLGNITSKIL